MPNYKQCRLCTGKYIQQSDERICSKCEEDIVRAVSMPTGKPVVLDAKEPEPEAPIIDVMNMEVPKAPEPEPEPEPAPEITEKNIETLKKTAEIITEIITEEIEAPEPVIVEATAPKSAEEARKQDEEVINPTE